MNAMHLETVILRTFPRWTTHWQLQRGSATCIGIRITSGSW